MAVVAVGAVVVLAAVVLAPAEVVAVVAEAPEVVALTAGSDGNNGKKSGPGRKGASSSSRVSRGCCSSCCRSCCCSVRAMLLRTDMMTMARTATVQQEQKATKSPQKSGSRNRVFVSRMLEAIFSLLKAPQSKQHQSKT